jgi:peptidoglycan/LPS O-acetylase OafA/YrhL
VKAITKKLEKFFLLNQNRSIPEFDGLRAWAVLMVLAVHIQSWLLNIASETHESSFTIQAVQKIFHFMPFIGSVGGDVGVDLFFMISGFLIFLTIHKKKTSFLEFIKKRYKRLLPVHIILILYSIVFLPLIGIFLNLFFLVDFFPSYSNVNPVTWTLGYEMLFYLIAGIWFITLARVVKLQGWPFFFIVFIAVVLSQWIIGSVAEDIGLKYPDMNRFIAFFFGVGLAKIYYLNNILWEKMSSFLPNFLCRD